MRAKQKSTSFIKLFPYRRIWCHRRGPRHNKIIRLNVGIGHNRWKPQPCTMIINLTNEITVISCGSLSNNRKQKKINYLEHFMMITLCLNIRISRLLRHLVDIGTLVQHQLGHNNFIQKHFFVRNICEHLDSIHKLLYFCTKNIKLGNIFGEKKCRTEQRDNQTSF